MKPTMVHQTKRTVQTDTFLMKDFDEGTGHLTQSYLGSASDHQKPLSLDLSPLQVIALEQRIHLDAIVTDSLLLI